MTWFDGQFVVLFQRGACQIAALMLRKRCWFDGQFVVSFMCGLEFQL